MSFEIVRGDNTPMDVDLTADTSSADSVQLRWAKPDGTTYLTNLTEVDASAGEYQMEWGPDDTDTVGPHVGEVIVTTGSLVETYPADGSKIIWWVNPQVGDLVSDA